MPITSQGNIFQAAANNQLTIIFGHIGFNLMNHYWTVFKQQHATLSSVRDPFVSLNNQAIEWAPDRWLWFIAAAENNGMSDEQLKNQLDHALAWAANHNIGSVLTNGIGNTDLGRDSAANQRSHHQRVNWLKNYARDAEQQYGLIIELISLNDVFVKNESTAS